jgi:hypothetical protein
VIDFLLFNAMMQQFSLLDSTIDFFFRRKVGDGEINWVHDEGKP